MLLRDTNWVFPFQSSDTERFWIGPIYFNGVSFVISRIILAVLLHKTYDHVSKGEEQIFSHIKSTSGTPLLDIFVWAVLRCHTHRSGLAASEGLTTSDPEDGEVVVDMHQIYECPFFAEIQKIDHIVYNIPVFVLLSCNVFFLIWIMTVSTT